MGRDPPPVTTRVGRDPQGPYLLGISKRVTVMLTVGVVTHAARDRRGVTTPTSRGKGFSAHLFGRVRVGGLAGHEVEEGVEEDESGVVGVDDGADALEVDVALLVLAERVAEADQTRLELVGLEMAGAVLVEVVERAAELVELLLRDTLRVARQDLVLHLVDVAVDGRQQLLPADAQRLHRVLRVAVLEHHRLLNALVQLLQLVHVRLVRVHVLFVLLQPHQLVLQRSLRSFHGFVC